ncbi:MAG: hypothetical protein IJH83_08025 [Coriobacteriales bacterium]|nr:hypothetical protein [Coriobacteriales bacterium]
MAQNHSCPGSQLPADATLQMRVEACKGCTDENCSSREIAYSGSKWKAISLFCISFCVMAAALLVVRYYFF